MTYITRASPLDMRDSINRTDGTPASDLAAPPAIAARVTAAGLIASGKG